MINSTDSRLLTFINSAISKDITYIDDPTYLGFTLLFDFEDSISDKYSFENCSPLFSEYSDRNSAINYLKRIGEHDRATLLKSFKDKLTKINKEFPYYFQKCSGIGNWNSFKEYTNARLTDTEIVIDTLDSMDFRITSMIEDYMGAVYDFNYSRLVVPENLLRFKVCIQISEIRNIRTFMQDINNYYFENLNTKESYNDEIGNKLNLIILEYDWCLFDFSKSTNFDEILNTAPEQHKNSFSIKPGRLTMKRKMNFTNFLNQVVIDSVLGSDYNSNTEFHSTPLSRSDVKPSTLLSRTQDRIIGDIQDFASILASRPPQNLSIESLAERGINDILNQIKYKINNVLLGNIYDNPNFGDVYSKVKEFVLQKIQGQNSLSIQNIPPLILPQINLANAQNLGDIDNTKFDIPKEQLPNAKEQYIHETNSGLGDIDDNAINLPNQIPPSNTEQYKHINNPDLGEFGRLRPNFTRPNLPKDKDGYIHNVGSGLGDIDNTQLSNEKITNSYIDVSQLSNDDIENKKIGDTPSKNITPSNQNSNVGEPSTNALPNVEQQNVQKPVIKSSNDLGMFNFAVSDNKINKTVLETNPSKNENPNNTIENPKPSDNTLKKVNTTDISSNDNLLKLYTSNIGKIEESPIEQILKRVAIGSLGNLKDERDNKDNRPKN